MGVAVKAALLVAAVLLAQAPLAALAQAPANTVSILRDDADAVQPGRVLHPGNTSIMSLASTRSEFRLYVVDDQPWPNDESYSLEFSAPVEHEMTTGVYDRAWREFRNDPDGRPGINVDGCDGPGRFEVKDIAFGPDDNLDRVWLVYEESCLGGGAVVGEVRLDMNAPAAPTPTVVRPSLMRWSETDLGRQNGALPATVLASRATQIASVGVGGEEPGAFPVVSDGCSGASLAAGGTCQVLLRFSPSGAGTHRALLTVTESSGATHEVPLEGFSWGATTRASLTPESDPSMSVAYTPANADFSATLQNENALRLMVTPHDGYPVDAGFSPGLGHALAAGHYVDPGPQTDSTQPNLDVTAYGSGCQETRGDFTITDVRFHKDGEVRAAGVDFTQYCEGSSAALRGTLEFRKGDDTPPAPWITESWAGIPMEPGQYEAGPPWVAEPVPGPEDGPAPNLGPDPPAPEHPTRPCEGRTFSKAVTILGSSRGDILKGHRRRDDLILARGGNDRVLGFGGRDCIDGGRGRDRLSGGPGNDVIFGGPGRDRIDCGRGRHDIARVTRGDRTRGCERKVRRG